MDVKSSQAQPTRRQPEQSLSNQSSSEQSLSARQSSVEALQDSEAYQELTENIGSEERAPAGKAKSPRNISQLERLISLGAGSVLSLAGISRGKVSGLAMLGVGAALVHRGVTGHCHGYHLLGMNTAEHSSATVVPAKQGVQFERALTIQSTPAELYAFWREVENLPKIMRHLKQVEAIDQKTSHWVASGPLNMSVEWDAEVFNERENEFIAWRSLPEGDVETAGSVHFKPLPQDRGTEVRVVMRYNPPTGVMGAKLADLLGVGLEQQIDTDLQRFKGQMETGEVASIDGQPRGSS